MIGHDDTPLASLFVPALSSVRIDSAGLGRYMAETALAAMIDLPTPLAGPAGEAVVIQRATS
ncbi:substrate-binding domain-containing protein (plasmid) [Herbiconiux sp. KACC 21604]|uniref:substrate-binding domain-containing protein n=1 Tax=unclassified Herbiconiux TaxID=2618217 RepID=UPI001491DC65|nr:substrate-binding domain-containing protein [Herbiconiux sp. SALV-R1]WPO88847.1 substrate-binding domain-containing protein [Herbiconiux sp. KACC 21604]